MIEFIELLVWIDSIVSLNIETMTPAKRAVCVAIYGCLGIVFRGRRRGPAVRRRTGSRLTIFGGLVVSLIGVGFLARIAYGLLALRRLKRGSA